ncbi:MAG: hypothetical protein WD135_05285 [Ferruginibacter sp.]
MKTKKARYIISGTKIVAVAIMYLGLFPLTGANFFVYKAGLQTEKRSSTNDCSQEKNLPNPEEEHSKSNQVPSIQEEYLHEKHTHNNFAWLTSLLYLRIVDAEKLQIVHYDSYLLPPSCCNPLLIWLLQVGRFACISLLYLNFSAFIFGVCFNNCSMTNGEFH